MPLYALPASAGQLVPRTCYRPEHTPCHGRAQPTGGSALTMMRSVAALAGGWRVSAWSSVLWATPVSLQALSPGERRQAERLRQA
jgi:hypothetical protein